MWQPGQVVCVSRPAHAHTHRGHVTSQHPAWWKFYSVCSRRRISFPSQHWKMADEFVRQKLKEWGLQDHVEKFQGKS